MPKGPQGRSPPKAPKRTEPMYDFKKLNLSECIEALLKLENPAVAMHIRPDGDTVGSAMALSEIFKRLGKDAPYIIADEIPERLAFLTEGCRRITSGSGYQIVSIDVASPSQLGSLYETDRPVLSIDHHQVNTPYCTNYTVPSASSAGEVLFSIAKELSARGLIKLDEKIASRIYAAISSDTGGFMFSNASGATYKAAAELISVGIDHAEINRKLFFSKSEDQLRAEGYSAANLKTAENGRIAYLTVSKNEREALGIPFAAFETAIDIVRSLIGTEIAFVIKETDRGEYKASLRSNGKNVAEIAARHGGGGHIRAAGCTVIASELQSAAQILLSELK